MHKIADFERPSFNRSATFLSMLFSKNMLELLFLVSLTNFIIMKIVYHVLKVGAVWKSFRNIDKNVLKSVYES